MCSCPASAWLGLRCFNQSPTRTCGTSISGSCFFSCCPSFMSYYFNFSTTLFSGQPMKLNDEPEKFYLTSKDGHTLCGVVVLFPRHLAFRGKTFIPIGRGMTMRTMNHLPCNLTMSHMSHMSQLLYPPVSSNMFCWTISL